MMAGCFSTSTVNSPPSWAGTRLFPWNLSNCQEKSKSEQARQAPCVLHTTFPGPPGVLGGCYMRLQDSGRDCPSVPPSPHWLLSPSILSANAVQVFTPTDGLQSLIHLVHRGKRGSNSVSSTALRLHLPAGWDLTERKSIFVCPLSSAVYFRFVGYLY